MRVLLMLNIESDSEKMEDDVFEPLDFDQNLEASLAKQISYKDVKKEKMTLFSLPWMARLLHF